MSSTILKIAEMTSPEIDALDRARTLFVMALSPLEVHGPHLPLGTDVIVAEEIRDRALAKLSERLPDFDFVLFPSYSLGSDTIPRSMEVDSRAVFYVVSAAAAFLADRGFRYLLVTDNHGGPRHQIATAKAVRKAFKRGVSVCAPFLSFYRRMVENDPVLMDRLGAGPGACGDTDDCHAGLNETSLMLKASPGQVRGEWTGLQRTAIGRRRWPNLLLGNVGRLLQALGAGKLAADVRYLGVMLSWVTMKEPHTYIGEPGAASEQAGDRMLDAFSDEAVEAVEAAVAGGEPYHTPIGWSLRFLEPSH
ncbi:MAG: creatininase family protein [Actinobacteria bacterium]|nr:creatininase family protein [Actinomycetota bacterium]MBU1943928.1 creatininase family protein [Actinomycetota bacterium]MBU2686453.1 creatininase family protein [Actinomycetota bacterium]